MRVPGPEVNAFKKAQERLLAKDHVAARSDFVKLRNLAGGGRPIAPMTTESTFRAAALCSVALCLPIGLYFRIKSRSTGERLSRREEGVFIMVGLRACGAWPGPCSPRT